MEATNENPLPPRFSNNDAPTSSVLIRQLLNGQTAEVGLTADLDAGHYLRA